MDNIETLTQLLTNSGCDYHIYDLGRRIQPVDNALFSKVELGQQAYPYPLKRHAHIAISYWNEQKQPWIWFLKFPLDERGLLKQSDIGNFIKYVVEAMGSRLSGELSEEQQQKLSNNPYTFKPTEDKLALFHSVVRAQLDLPTSQYYAHAKEYFSGALGWSNWQTVGLQGITDICARLNDEQNSVMVRKALANVSDQPLYALLGALEHIDLNSKLAESLFEKTQAEINSDQPDLFLLSALIRGLAGADVATQTKAVSSILDSALLSHQEILIAIAGRNWQVLQDAKLAEQFLVRLAQTNNQSLFNQLFADLVMLPALRMTLLPLLHGAPSPELAKALVQLQRATKGEASH